MNESITKTAATQAADHLRSMAETLAEIRDQPQAEQERELKKLKFRGQGGDLVRELIKGQIVEIQGQIAQNREKLAVAQRALELVQEYEYEVSGQAPQAYDNLFVS